MPLLDEGQSNRDTCEVERFPGEGALAEVYRVRHRFAGRQAMKVLKKEGISAAISAAESAIGNSKFKDKACHGKFCKQQTK